MVLKSNGVRPEWDENSVLVASGYRQDGLSSSPGFPQIECRVAMNGSVSTAAGAAARSRDVVDRAH